MSIENRQYKITKKNNPNKALQINLSSKRVRELKRIENNLNNYKEIIFWFWKDDKNEWRLFDDKLSFRIENMPIQSQVIYI